MDYRGLVSWSAKILVTPGNPETMEIPEFRYVKITESGYGVDYSYAPYSELGDSCLV